MICDRNFNGNWLKCEELSRTIDKDNYYPGRIIISSKEDATTDTYWPYQAKDYEQIRKQLRYDTYMALGSGMGTYVLYKKISPNRILMKIIDDVDYNTGVADKIEKDFIGNRTEQKLLIDYSLKKFPKQKEINQPSNINGVFYAPIL